MAKSLSKIIGQIEKLQKEAAAIQTTVIARIKREIALHGLTAEHLFGTANSTYVGNGRAAVTSSAAAKSTPAKAAAKTAGASKPAKFADDKGNTWHGIGKRPQWLRDMLAAGHSLEEFLVSSKKAAPVAKKARAALKAVPTPAKKKVVAKKKVAPAKKTVTPAKAPKAAVAAKPSAKASTRKTAKVETTKKAPVKRATRVKAAEPADVVQPVA